MSSAERDILSGIDRFLKTPMQKNERLPAWVCMMQMILTYRDVLCFVGANQLGFSGIEARRFLRPSMCEKAFANVYP